MNNINNGGGGIAGVTSSSSSITSSSSNVITFKLGASIGTLGYVCRYLIILICICLILYGLYQIMSGSQNNSNDKTSEGYKFVRIGSTFYIVFIIGISVFNIIGKYGFKKSLFTILTIGGIGILMFLIPMQWISGTIKQLFFEWFEDSDIERVALKSFNSLRVLPILAIVLITIAGILIWLI